MIVKLIINTENLSLGAMVFWFLKEVEALQNRNIDTIFDIQSNKIYK